MGGLDWTGLKGTFFFTEEGVVLEDRLGFGGAAGGTVKRWGPFKSGGRRRGLCLLPSEDVCQRFPDLYPHTAAPAHFLSIFHSDRQDMLYGPM